MQFKRFMLANVNENEGFLTKNMPTDQPTTYRNELIYLDRSLITYVQSPGTIYKALDLFCRVKEVIWKFFFYHFVSIFGKKRLSKRVEIGIF